MRNLKRALSLVMAMALIVGMMVVSASAAGKDFTDKDEIQHTEAVEVMTALNVISGKEDGSYFDPTGTLTRAEMAKIVAYVMNGGVEPNIGTKVVPTYSDIDNHWAEAYIEYCTSMGIIAGDGAGKFNPNGTLTASQTAKMFLTAMGYNAQVFGLLGNDWETNTNRYANEAGLYKDLGNVSVSAPISRDAAAQMAYNAIQAYMMERDWSQNQQTGQITEGYRLGTKTLMNEKFNANVEYAYMTDISYDSVKDEYTYSFNDDGTAFGVDNTPAVTEDAFTMASLKTSEDYSALFGMRVKVIYKDSASEKYPVYGMYSDAAVVAEGTLGDIGAASGSTIGATDTQVKINGTKYSLDKTAADVDLFAFNDTSAKGTLQTNTLADYTKFAAIDNDGDGKINMLVVYPVTLAKVTYVGTSSITAGGVSYAYNEDEDCYENGGNQYDFPEVKKDDYVVITTDVIDNMNYTAEVVPTIEGKVTALDAPNTKAQIDGTWYTYLTANPTINSTYKFQVVNGYLAASEEIESASKDLLYVVASENGNSMNKAQADVMFTDGVREVIDINKKDGSTANGSNALTPDALYTYTKNSDGTYDVKAVTASNLAGYDGFVTSGANNYTEATSTTNATLGGKLIADDAIIFVKSTTSSGTEYSVITGATLKTYGSESSTGMMLTGTASGLSSVKVATMAVSSVFGVTDTYAFITSDPYTTVEDGVTYYHYTAWTADGSVEVKDAPASGTPVKGAVVTLVNKADGTVSSSALAAANGNNATVKVPVAITGFNGTDRTITMVKSDGTILQTAALKYGEDVQFLYVNTKDNVGLEGGEVALAEQLPDGSYNMNAYAIYTCNGSGTFNELTAIVFDVNNKLEGVAAAGFTLPTLTVTGLNTATNITNAVAAAYPTDVDTGVAGGTVDVVITANDTSDTVISGDGVTFTVSNSAGNSATATVAAGTYAKGTTIATISIPCDSTSITVVSANVS